MTWTIGLLMAGTEARAQCSVELASGFRAPLGIALSNKGNLLVAETGIREFGGQLLVTLFRGFPFPPGTSTVEQIDPETGAQSQVLAGRRTAIDVLVTGAGSSLMVLEHASGPLLPPFSGPGSLTAWSAAGSSVLANCLGRPTSMVQDDRKGLVYITELIGGRVVVVHRPDATAPGGSPN